MMSTVNQFFKIIVGTYTLKEICNIVRPPNTVTVINVIFKLQSSYKFPAVYSMCQKFILKNWMRADKKGAIFGPSYMLQV